ncbi:MAG: amidase, partial [Nitriliruptorales bacterium]
MSALDPVFDSGAGALAAAVNRGEVDLGELEEAIVERLGRAPRGSLLAVDTDGVGEQLRELARRLADGERPRLAGVPVAHKDLFDTVRFPTTYGNPALGSRPERDAVAVTRIAEQGAIQVGKANCHEIAFGVTGRNPHTGDVENPAAPGRMTGGSSSGSAAAVAAGVVLGSLGTDTGGSVRIPASCCGIVGVKTTRGAVPRTGVLPLSNLQDSVGPLAGSVADAAVFLDAIVGPDVDDASTLPVPNGWKATPALGRLAHELDGVELVLPRQFWEGRVAAEVATRCREAVERLEAEGAKLAEADLPGLEAARRAQATLLSVHALVVH